MMMIPVHVIAFFLAIMMVPEDVKQFTIAVQGKEIQWTRQEAGWHAVELPRDDAGIYSVKGSEVTIAGEGHKLKTNISRFLALLDDMDWKKAEEVQVAVKSLGDSVRIQREEGKIILTQVKGALFENPVTITWQPVNKGVNREAGPSGADGALRLATGVEELAITHKQSKIETSLGEMAVTEYFRGDSLILKKVVPPDESLNTVYYVIHNGFEVLTYKSGPTGTEFAGAGVIRDQVKPDYTIKMAGDKKGRIQRITLYSPDFSKTYDGFWLRDKQLVPWSAEELAGWREMRDSKRPKAE